MRLLLVSCLLLVAVNAEQKAKDYTGYKLIEVTPTTDDHLRELQQLEEREQIDFWTHARKSHATSFILPPKLYKVVSKRLEKMGMPVTLKNSNIQMAFEKEKRDNEHARVRAKAQQSIVNTFPRFDDINTWLQEQVQKNSQIATLIDIGRTYQGRSMKVIKIGKPQSRWSTTEKPSIWIDAGIHAREWLTVGTTIYMIERLLNDYGTNTEVTNLVNTYDWYFLPSANPDGYEYTHTGDRLWRKTRSPTWSYRCTGADPNRNFDFHFAESGVSSNPCSMTYPGPSAFSERCTTNIKNFVYSKKNSLKLFFTLHAYSQMWLTPYAYGYAKPSDYSELLRVANIGASAIKAVNGRSFTVGTPPEILYAAAGGSYDWAKGVAGIKYAYAMELYPGPNAYNGFVVPQSEIANSGKEMWAATRAIVNAMR